MTVFLTVLSGVITYILGQFVLKIILEPAQDMRRTVGEISHVLIDYAYIIFNPGTPEEQTIHDASGHLRSLGSKLRSHLYLVPYYKHTAKLFGLPSLEEVDIASKALVGISNNIFKCRDNTIDLNIKWEKQITGSLKIYPSHSEQ